MSITWKIENMERRTSDGFVIAVHWRVTAEDAGFSATACGSCAFDGENPDVAYEDLTEQDVLSWLYENGIDKDAYEASLLAKIESDKTPAQLNGVPW